MGGLAHADDVFHRGIVLDGVGGGEMAAPEGQASAEMLRQIGTDHGVYWISKSSPHPQSPPNPWLFG